MRTKATRSNLRGESGHQSPANPHTAAVGLLCDDSDQGDAWPQATEYLRQDELDLARRVKNFLAGRNLPGLRRLSIDVDGSSVVLRGTVRTFYEKLLAVHCCQRVAGVINVVDGIEVAA